MRPQTPAAVYPITRSSTGGVSHHFALAEAYLDAGIRFFQVREKDLADRLRLIEFCRVAEICRQANASLIVNDRADLARLSGAAGVHLGQEDIPVAEARTVLPGPSIIGISTHSPEEFLAAQQLEVDYVALGPIFDTPTKPGALRPLGLEVVRRLVPGKLKPMVAIGGIDLARASQLWALGVDSVAVVSDINEASSVRKRIKDYLAASRG